MNPIYAFYISVIGLIISAIALALSGGALLITYRRDAHRIHLEVFDVKHGGVVLGIVNDSGISTSVRSIGIFHNFHDLVWLNRVGVNDTNLQGEFPFAVEARSTFGAYFNSVRQPEYDPSAGLIVQLNTGRLYVLTRDVHWFTALLFRLTAWWSRVTGGRYAPGIDRPRYKTYG